MGLNQRKVDDYPRFAELELLLVEDNAADATIISELIKENGFSGAIRWVSDGAEALDYLFQRGKYVSSVAPHVIILDLNLPKLDGREVLQTLARDERLRSIPVAVLTTSNRPQDILQCHEFHAGTYLVKPRTLPQFESLVQRLLKVELPRLVDGRNS